MAHLAFLFVCVTWGASFILMERATHAFGPVGVAIGRLGGGAAVLAIVWWMQRGRHRIDWADVPRIAGVALVGTALPFAVQPYCLAQGFGHSYFGMMVGLTPLATIVVSVPMLGLWPTARQVLGVLGGLLCMLLLLYDGSLRGISPGILALGLTVPVCYGLGNNFVKWKLSHVHSLPLTTLLLATATAWLVPMELVPGMLARLGLGGPTPPHDWPMALGAIAVLGILGTGFALLLVNWLIVTKGPLFAGMVTYVVPTLALVWGAVDGEMITSRQLLAMAGVLGMVALVQVGRAESGKPPLRQAQDRAAFDELRTGGEAREPLICPSEVPVDVVLLEPADGDLSRS